MTDQDLAYVKAVTQDVCLVTEPDAEHIAAMSAYTTARTAHHEAGHAVAAVIRGGERRMRANMIVSIAVPIGGP
jgi:hypothetical protein